MKIIFMGSPDFAIPTLTALINSPKHQVIACYTSPPKKRNRGQKEDLTPVHKLANKHSIAVFCPNNFKNPEDIASFVNLDADIAVVAAYGLLLPKQILDAPKYGCINLHPSDLPRWRGAAPINRTIMSGDKATKVCIMKMEQGLDSGDVYVSQDLTIEPHTTAGILHDKCAEIGSHLILNTIENFDNIKPQKQSGEIVYAKKIKKAECLINWNQSAKIINQNILGLSPYPASYFLHNKKRIKVFKSKVVELKPNASSKYKAGDFIDHQNMVIACADNALQLLELQQEGKKKQSLKEFVKGFKF